MGLVVFLVPLIELYFTPASSSGQPCVPIDGRALSIVLWLYIGAPFALGVALVAGLGTYAIRRIAPISDIMAPVYCMLLLVGLFVLMRPPTQAEQREEYVSRIDAIHALIDAEDMDGLLHNDADGQGRFDNLKALSERLEDPAALSEEQLDFLLDYYRERIALTLEPRTDRRDFWVLKREKQARAGGVTKVAGWQERPAELFDQFTDTIHGDRIGDVTDDGDLRAIYTFAEEHMVSNDSAVWVAIAAGVRTQRDLAPLIERVRIVSEMRGKPWLAGAMLRASTDAEAMARRPGAERLRTKEFDALVHTARSIHRRREDGSFKGRAGSDLHAFIKKFGLRILREKGVEEFRPFLAFSGITVLAAPESVGILAEFPPQARATLSADIEQRVGNVRAHEEVSFPVALAAMRVLSETDPSCSILDGLSDHRNTDMRRRVAAMALEVCIHEKVSVCRGDDGVVTAAARDRIERLKGKLRRGGKRKDLVRRTEAWLEAQAPLH